MSSELRPRRIRRWVAGAAAAALLAAGGLGWFSRRGPSAAATEAPVAVATATVVKTDMSATESLTGTLGYGPARPVKGGEGIVTWLPQPGRRIKRGSQVYRVDDRPVPLFYGSLPLYRTIAEPGTVGRDVRLVARNLEALGYAIGSQPARKPPPVIVRKGEAVLTSALRAAIKRWQQDAGLPVTGVIGVGDVVVLPGAARIEAVTAQPGDSAAEPLLTVTSTAKLITVAAEVGEAAKIKRGDAVTVLLPGDKSVPGEVSAIGTAVQKEEEASSDGPQRTVTVTVDGDKGLGDIDAAEVQVDFAGETRRGVLAVPVGALVALSEGGYAVQVAGGGLIAVTTGMFAMGLVEVSGDGLAEDLTVVTAS